MKAGAVDVWDRSYSFIKSLTTPDKVAWLEDTVSQYWELAVEYWSTGWEYACTGAAMAWVMAQSYYNTSSEYITVNFIKLDFFS